MKKKRIYYDPQKGYVDEDGKPISEETEPKEEVKKNEPTKARK